MNAKFWFVILALVAVIALAACGQTPAAPATGQPPSAPPAAATQAPGAPPPAATQPPGAPPAATQAPGALPGALQTPSPTPPPAVCDTYDDFNNKAFDGKYDPALFPEAVSGQALYFTVQQHDGFFEISNTAPVPANSNSVYTLELKKPGARSVDQVTCFEAKMRLGGAAHKAGYPSIRMRLVSDLNDVSECRLDSPQPGGPPLVRCELVGKFTTPAAPAKYDTFHKVRMEIQPDVVNKSLTYKYLLDDAVIGTFTTGATVSFNAKFVPSIQATWNSASTIAAAYFDDIKITPAK